MRTFDTKRLASEADAIAPDGSAVRVLARVPGCSTAQFELGPKQISTAVASRTVDEIWFVTGGRGRIWRKLRDQEETVDLFPGVSVTIPVGTHFQFMNCDFEPLVVLGVTTPPWPEQGDAYPVRGTWKATVGDALRRDEALAAAVTGRDLAIARTRKDHVHKKSGTCGDLVEVLSPGEYERLDVAIASDIKDTNGHFHAGFDEIYLMMEGGITLRLYDPEADREWNSTDPRAKPRLHLPARPPIPRALTLPVDCARPKRGSPQRPPTPPLLRAPGARFERDP